MFPELLHIGPITLYTYGLMIAIGFLVSVFFMSRDAEKVGIKASDFSEMAFWGLIIGIAGTRIAHIIMYPEHYSWSDPLGWFALWNGGLVFQGAIPAVIIYAAIILRLRGIPFWKIPDVAFPYVPLAQAFGRIGCLCFGCCYGMRADNLPWAIRFPEGSPAFERHVAQFPDFPGAGHSFPVHPTQIYSVLGLLLLMGLLLLGRRCINVQGITFPLYLMIYGVMRFIVEFLRGDGNPTNLAMGVLSNQQVFCIFMFVCGGALLVYLWRRPQPPQPAPWYKKSVPPAG